MARSTEGRHKRAGRVKARVAAPNHSRFPKCTIIGCGRPTTGLAIALCRKHLLHRQRHGSPFCPSPTATILKPYLTAATALVKGHQDSVFIRAALAGLHDLLQSAGEVIEATRLRGLPPAERAQAALARLRNANVQPERLMGIVLAVHALIKHDPVKTHRIKEWRVVAIAKAAHRLASGYHRVWEARDDSGRIVQRTEMHKYPRSSGRVLRYLGEAIESKCDWVIDQHLDQVVAGVPPTDARSITS